MSSSDNPSRTAKLVGDVVSQFIDRSFGDFGDVACLSSVVVMLLIMAVVVVVVSVGLLRTAEAMGSLAADVLFAAVTGMVLLVLVVVTMFVVTVFERKLSTGVPSMGFH